MLLVLASLLTASAAPLSFEFVGQPECVALEWTGQRTRVVNDCEHPILIDQSVQLPVEGQRNGLIPAGATTQVRDLSAFTLGLKGQLYRVVAVIAEPDAPAEDPQGKASADTGY